MKQFLNLVLVISLLATGCRAQTKTLEVVNATRGNTGHVGIIPQDQMDKPMPQGKDYFALELKILRNCRLELVNLTVKTDGGQVNLKPLWNGGKTKLIAKKDEVVYLRADKEKNQTVAKPNIAGEGNLAIKVNGKRTSITVKEFILFIPQ